MNFLLYTVSAFFTCYFCIYCCHYWAGKKIDYRSIKTYISIIIIAVLGTTISFLQLNVFKILILIVIITSTNYYMFFKNFKVSLLTAIICELIAFLAEIIIALPMSFLSENLLVFCRTGIGAIFINLGVMIVSFMLLRLSIFTKIYSYVFSKVDHINNIVLFIYSVVIIIIVNILAVLCYANFDFRIMMILSSLLIIGYIIIGFKMLSEVNKAEKMSAKYNTSLNNLKELELIIDQYKIATHENKNELLRISTMIKNKEKDIDVYIDKLISNKTKNAVRVIEDVFNIPDGGLKATIYSKLCVMDTLKIKHEIQISKDFKKINFENLDDDTMLDICKIMGVYLDNAIEAAKNSEKKIVIIEMYLDDDLCIDISNSYEGVINIEKIGKTQYTTKGGNHGYGLLLVEKLSAENDRLEVLHKDLDTMFRQSLKIKM